MLLHCDWRVNIVFPDHFLSYSVARCFILCNAWSWLDPPSPAHFCSPFFYILNALLFPFRLIDWSDCFVFCHVLSHFAKTPNIPAPPLSSSDPPSIVYSTWIMASEPSETVLPSPRKTLLYPLFVPPRLYAVFFAYGFSFPLLAISESLFSLGV